MSWALWDQEHRSQNVRIAKSATGGLRVTSGGKHLGNIEHLNGKHVSVIKKGGALEHTEHASHADALNHIREAHGLGKGGGKADAEAQALIDKHAAPAKKATSAEQLAAQIRGALGTGTTSAPKTTESKVKKSTSTVVKAEGSKAAVVHGLGKQKSAALKKGEKYHSDSIKTKIHIAAWKAKKAGGGGVPAPKKAAPVAARSKDVHKKISDKAVDLTKAAASAKTAQAHRDAAQAHEAAAKVGYTPPGSSSMFHAHWAKYHTQQAEAIDKKEKTKKQLSDKAVALTEKAADEHTSDAHKAAGAAHKAASDAGAVPANGSTTFHENMVGYHRLQAAALAPQEQHKSDLNTKAKAASKAALDHDTVANHLAAAQAHEAAHIAGAKYEGLLGSHQAHANYHAAVAKKLEEEKAAKAAKKTASAPAAAKKTTTPPPAAADQVVLSKQVGVYGGLSNMAYKATEQANKDHTFESHQTAHIAHLQAAKSATVSNNHVLAEAHTKAAQKHGEIADKLKPSPPAKKTTAKKAAAPAASNAPTEAELKSKAGKSKKAADAATVEANKVGTADAHWAAYKAHVQAYTDTKAAGFDSWSKKHAAQSKVHYDLYNNATLSSGHTPIAAAPTHVPAGPLPSGGHSSSELEKKADAAHLASQKAAANPTKANHQAAYEAHKSAYNASHYDSGAKAGTYHHMMMSYHEVAANNPAVLKEPAILKEHKDDMSKLFPAETHGFHVGFMDTASRRNGQKAYDSISKASATGLTIHERSSIGAYTGSHYSSINNALRTGNTGGPTVQQHVKNLDSAFAKQPGIKEQITTYRGVSSPEKMFGAVGSHVGAEFEDKGYGSTASHAAVTQGFSSQQGALIRILHPAGSKLLKPSDVGNFGDSERELLVPRGTKYHVAADRLVTDQNGHQRRVIDLVRKE